MAYLIESVFTMLALTAKTQDRQIKYFYKLFEQFINLIQIQPE
ncbi:hypothetical protein BN2497_805 [Janthinobacterium sp. CG23_2]|nr:hypothetical protein BN2497_805 [Janthinobacterium sp. CG23_2]CUU26800.1 hypothetical protein BN3177_805 [Janthinobacterium sp. CG23_2]